MERARLEHEHGEKQGRSCPACGATVSLRRCGSCGAAAEAGEFFIERVIAQTDHSRVYLALTRAGERVALKEILFARVPEAAQLDAFERECALLSQLSHPRIPRYLGSFSEGDGVERRLYLAQEFIPGSSLLEKLKTHTFSEAECRELAQQILPILAYLHGRSPQVIHRDLKPSNLLLRDDGQLMLVDFGVARSITSRTHGSTLVGTFGYMPLEQLGGTVDATSDLYALGATLVHLLSREPPERMLGPGYKLEFGGKVSVSPAFARFLSTLTASSVTDRFATAELALEALAETDHGKRRVVIGALVVGLVLNVAVGTMYLLGRDGQNASAPLPHSARFTEAKPSNAAADPELLRLEPKGAEALAAELQRLRASGMEDLATRLEAKVAEVRARFRAENGDTVAVIRTTVATGKGVALPGADADPIEGQYFVQLLLPTMRWPVRFHGYYPAELELTRRPGEVCYLEAVPLRPLDAKTRAELRGRISLPEQLERKRIWASIGLSHGYFGDRNTQVSEAPLENYRRFEVDANGQFQLGNLVPAEYDLSLRVPGRVDLYRRLSLRPGMLDLGEIELEIPKPLSISFLFASGPDFSSATLRKQLVQGGMRWSATPQSEALNDLVFKQTGGRITFSYYHGMTRMIDLGAGSLEEHRGVDPSAFQLIRPDEVPLQLGHVYLLQSRPDRWVLFVLAEPS